MASGYFARDYSEARARFISAANRAGGRMDTYRNPNAKGPDGEALCTDVALFTRPGVTKALVIVSGVHGNEGFCGSACQVGFLERGWLNRCPADTMVLLIHAINPFGFAHVRRVNEDNVDINRNFVDHSKPYTPNPDYDAIHAFAVPEHWDATGLAAADAGLEAFVRARGPMALQSALSSGQHTHPDGVFFAGHGPVWSNRVLRTIVETYLAGLDHIALVDVHTGLGPRGHGELILNGDFNASYTRAQSWYDGEVTSFEDGSSTSAKLTGMMNLAFTDVLGPEKLTGITVEYGTHDLATVLHAIRFDNWVNLYETPGTSRWLEAKTAIRNALYCDDDDWKTQVWQRAEWVYERAYAGLQSV